MPFRSSHLRPRLSFMPTIVKALKTPGNDPLAKGFKKSLGPFADEIIARWDVMPMEKKIRRYHLRTTPDITGDFKTKIISLAELYRKEKSELIQKRKELVRHEFDRYLQLGPGKYTPSPEIMRDPNLAQDFHHFMVVKTGANGCRCEKPGEDPPTEPPPPSAKYGFVMTRLQCYDQTEFGHDEIYLISTAVNGNGKVVTMITKKWSINDDQDNLFYPIVWIYPMEDPNGFLDVAVSMWEDDGKYDAVANAVKVAGEAAATVGTAVGNPYVLAGGIALVIIGNVISVIGDLDDDDDFGINYRTWASNSILEDGVGWYIFRYCGKDWSGDSYDYDVTFKLMRT